jgi:pimeloyl-ACP methyl ester carboxylesterase
MAAPGPSSSDMGEPKQRASRPAGASGPAHAELSTAFLPGADGLRIAADIAGPPDGPLVVFMHGGGQSRSAWAVAARSAAEAGYRAVSIDLRGHGHSDWSAEGDYHFSSYARDVAAIIAAAGGRAALVGASLGGRIAMLAAARYPEMIGAVALADVAPRINEVARTEMKTFFDETKDGFATVDEAAAVLVSLSGVGEPPPPERLRRHLNEKDGRLYWRWDPRFADERFIADPGETALLEESARSITAPLAIIRAEHSHVIGRDHLELFLALVPDAEAHEARGIGHMLTGDANDVYWPIVLDFLERKYRL